MWRGSEVNPNENEIPTSVLATMEATPKKSEDTMEDRDVWFHSHVTKSSSCSLHQNLRSSFLKFQLCLRLCLLIMSLHVEPVLTLDLVSSPLLSAPLMLIKFIQAVHAPSFGPGDHLEEDSPEVSRPILVCHDVCCTGYHVGP